MKPTTTERRLARRLVRALISPLARFAGGGWDSTFFFERDGRSILLGYSDQFGGLHQTELTIEEARAAAERLLGLVQRAESFPTE